MKQHAVTIDREYVVRLTSDRNRQIRDFLKRAESLKSDSRAEERAEAGICKVCFYLSGRIGGAAMTSRPCGVCSNGELYGSTYTDVLCRDCAEFHHLCKHCGADLSLDETRQEFPIQAPKAE